MNIFKKYFEKLKEALKEVLEKSLIVEEAVDSKELNTSDTKKYRTFWVIIVLGDTIDANDVYQLNGTTVHFSSEQKALSALTDLPKGFYKLEQWYNNY